MTNKVGYLAIKILTRLLKSYLNRPKSLPEI